jgi:SAM-dependent methyltransferase
MDEKELLRSFICLKERFDREDQRIIEEKGISVFNTTYGIYGSSSLRDVFDLFVRIRLWEKRAFVDLGSGDGRVALLAALFTNAVGVEGDDALHARAIRLQQEFKDALPQLDRCSLRCADYTQENLSPYDILFIYADHNWPRAFQEKLLRECRGTMLSLHNIFRPDVLPKGKTYWIHQMPFVSYALNVPADDLDVEAGDGGAPRDATRPSAR